MSPVRAAVLALAVAGIAAGGFFYQRADQLTRQLAAERKRGDELEAKVNRWRGMARDRLLEQEKGRSSDDSLLARTSFLDPLELDALRRRGLEDPVMDLKSDLMAHPELIPYEGTMGGTMRFPTASSIILLPGGYAHARFEDGHISGEAILTFSVGPGGRIQWRRIAARLD